ncbi:MAG TPA: aminotransferase class I/II-fold pyridoxal phosphate-dependent enzyme [Mycobacterium sp.]|nr:aminotransferase class I/II-fold pyridoxal phosphate-dependent enzyme [Mycobacterium sp.]
MAEPAFGTSVAAEVIASLPQAVDPHALSLNESPFPPLPAVRSALTHSLDGANRYPEFLPGQLPRMIADRIGVQDEQVVVGAGASGVAMQVLHAVTRPGDRIVMSTPTFDGYPIFAKMARLRPVTVPLDQYGYQDLVGMAEAAAEAKVVVLCRPHNPTGTLEAVFALEWFLQQIPSDTIVLLDKAYIEFVAARYRVDGPELVRRFPNVVVLRTFSKAYGLAGLRIGYGFAAPELAATVSALQLPFGMSNLAVAAVAASYDAEAQLAQRIRRITSERNNVRLRLMAMGVYSMDSHANFVYLPIARRPWREVFADAGLRVRCYDDGGARISVGDQSSTLAVLSAVEKSLT